MNEEMKKRRMMVKDEVGIGGGIAKEWKVERVVKVEVVVVLCGMKGRRLKYLGTSVPRYNHLRVDWGCTPAGEPKAPIGPPGVRVLQYPCFQVPRWSFRGW